MSTAHASRGAPATDEFPVLLRLPDLNASTWASAAAAAEPVSAPPAPVTATTEPVREPPRTSELPKPVPRGPSATQQLAEAGARARQTAQQWVTTLSKSTGFAEMPLVKQIAVGGFFIGGLALFCFFMFNRGNDVDLDDGVTAAVQMDSTATEKSSNDTMTVTPISPEKGRFESSPVPNNATGWEPSHVEVARVEPERPSEWRGGQEPVVGGQDARGPGEEVARDVRGPALAPIGGVQNLPALGARREAVASPYPTTDPGRFMYRPQGNLIPAENRRDMARLEGTIAPPSRR